MNLRCEGESRLPSQLYYEALCFKAVNQSIGRAIRHQRDYASLILADARYSRPSSKASLPGWIAQRLTVSEKFGSTVASVRKVSISAFYLLIYITWCISCIDSENIVINLIDS